MLEPNRYSEDSALLGDAVREAGALALTMLRQNVRRWVKSDGSPVTEADLAIDSLLTSRLRATRRDYGWLSEESQNDSTRTERRRLWIIDPIDGTQSFAQGGRDWCVAAALVEDGRTVVSAIYRPVPEEFYSAIAGQGAFLNGVRLAVQPGRGLKHTRIIGTRKSLAPYIEHGVIADISRSLPLQLRLTEVASGRAGGAVSIGLKNDWDLAAGELIVHEAGGRVSDSSGVPFVFNRKQSWQNGMIAASPGRHAALTRILGKA